MRAPAPLREVYTLAHRTAAEFSKDRCTSLAAAISYHVLFAMIPLVALMVALLGLVVRIPEVRRNVVEFVLGAVPLRQGMVVDAIRTLSNASEPLTIFGLLALVWTASGLFGNVRDALNIAWSVPKSRGLISQKLMDIGSVFGLGLLLGASVLGTTALHMVRHVSATLLSRYSLELEVLWDAVGWLFPATVTWLAFLLLYRYTPNVSHRVRDVWPGAVLAAVLFEAAKHAFTFYVAHFSRYEVLYGALGAVMLFLLWVYLSATILLLGAEFAQVWETRRRGAAMRVARSPAAAPARGSVGR